MCGTDVPYWLLDKVGASPYVIHKNRVLLVQTCSLPRCEGRGTDLPFSVSGREEDHKRVLLRV